MVAPSRGRLLRSSARGRAAHSIRRRLLAPFGRRDADSAFDSGPIIAGWIAALCDGRDRAATRRGRRARDARRDHHDRAAARRGGTHSRDARRAAARGDGGRRSTASSARSRARHDSRDSTRWWVAHRCRARASRSRRSTRRSFCRSGCWSRSRRVRRCARGSASQGRTSRAWSRRSSSCRCSLWNAQHGWISFVFQVRHGLSAPQGSALVAAWKHEGDFFGGQAALASPILFVMMAIAVGDRSTRRRRTRSDSCSAIVALVSFAFFVYSAFRQRVEPNWPAPAYIPAIVLLATIVVRTRRRESGSARASVLAAADVARHLRAGRCADSARSRRRRIRSRARSVGGSRARRDSTRRSVSTRRRARRRGSAAIDIRRRGARVPRRRRIRRRSRRTCRAARISTISGRAFPISRVPATIWSSSSTNPTEPHAAIVRAHSVLRL